MKQKVKNKASRAKGIETKTTEQRLDTINSHSTQKQLCEVIKAYSRSFDEIPSQATPDASNKVLQLLMARNAITEVMTRLLEREYTQIQTLIELDQKLKSKAVHLTDITGPQAFANWRESLQPPAGYWWWWLDERTLPKPNLLLNVLSALFLAASAALTAELARRFLSSGVDLAALPVPLFQAILTFLSGSLFTQTGQEGVERMLVTHSIPRKRYQLIKTGVPLVVLLAGISIYLLLPEFAKYYVRWSLNQKAYVLQDTGKLDEAIKNYERAITLAPDYAPVHYNLGDAYEISGEYDKAIAEYQAALRLDLKSTFAPFAYNNLARLFIIRRNDPSSAIRLIDEALKLGPHQPLNLYSLYKNRAWANYNLKCYSLAIADLCEAIRLNQKGAAAYCLLARVLEDWKQQGEASPPGACSVTEGGALEAWELCEAYKSGQEREIEADWLSLAQERLRKELLK